MREKRRTGTAIVSLLALWVVALQGCAGMKVYDACRKRAQSLGDMDDCMSNHGYSFVPVDAAWDPSIGECWDDRYANKIPMEYCYTMGGMPAPDAPYGMIE